VSFTLLLSEAVNSCIWREYRPTGRFLECSRY